MEEDYDVRLVVGAIERQHACTAMAKRSRSRIRRRAVTIARSVFNNRVRRVGSGARSHERRLALPLNRKSGGIGRVDWSGEYLFGATGAAFRGSAADNAPHRHATLQLVSGRGDIVTIEGPGGAALAGPAMLIRPGVLHTLHPAQRVTLVFLEPQSGAAREILAVAEPGGVAPLPVGVASLLSSDASLTTILVGIERPAAIDLDPRLQVALKFLGMAEGPRAIARAATAAGLSPPRLRALAQAQLDVPLTAWLAWHRLARAGASLATGATLAQAAVDAGFADQAHLSRAYRKVFGITPRTAQDVARAQQAKGSRP